VELRCDYGRLAPSYDRYRGLSASTIEHWLEKLIQAGGVTSASKVLDIGCGTGRLAIPLKEATGAEVFGLDISAEMLEQAKSKRGAEALHWILGDAQALPFPEGSFDFTLMCLVLHHIADKACAISEMYRVLRPGGRGLIWTISHRQIKDSLLNEFFPSFSQLDLQRCPSIPEIRSLMKGTGYAGVRAEKLTFAERTSTSRYIEKVRNKYISTLDLLSEAEFAAGMKRLARILPQRYGREMRRETQFTIVVGAK
jgi:SAM-dependent methyltransferase